MMKRLSILAILIVVAGPAARAQDALLVFGETGAGVPSAYTVPTTSPAFASEATPW